MPDVLSLEDIVEADGPRVGGKAASLAATLRAGLPVPAGFAITTDTYRRLHLRGIRTDAKICEDIREAYRTLGGAVAVRSSATGEDGAETSFAGQQETILGVVGEEAVLDAIERCWKSLHTERAIAYRAKQAIVDDSVAMAVVVQQLVPADTAGVLFTRDPMEPSAIRTIVEASYGLGEVVVSGRVTPDRFTLDSVTGQVLDQQLGRKTVRIVNGRDEPVPDDLQKVLCLNAIELEQLAELGRKVEGFYGSPRDIEWAITDGQVFLLQARPITTTNDNREAVRGEIIAELQVKADPRGTVWVRYNLSEILPQPTPMTWAVVQRLLAADGGIGLMNRDLGGDPDPALGGQSAFDLVAGRPMANLSRMPRLQFRHPPIEFPFKAFKENPKLALDPKSIVNPLRDGCLVGIFRLPKTIWRLWKMGSLAKKQADTFVAEFRENIVPPFIADAKAALALDFTKYQPHELVNLLNFWKRSTLVDFARDSLKPTFFAETAWSSLVELLKPKLGEERARIAVGELALGAKPDADADLAGALDDLANGRLDRAAFLERFGHRSAGEMELSVPRWSEGGFRDPKPGTGRVHSDDGTFDRIAKEAGLSGPMLAAARKDHEHLQTYLGLRESAKHYLLLGYAVIRKALVELDRRFALGGGIFYLTPDELPRLIEGENFTVEIVGRRKRRQTELTLELPPVLFSDDLDAIGRAVQLPEGLTSFAGVPLSAGVAEGQALVLREPSEVAEVDDGFVLVCPSTDPAWVPLFARARALVMETGGVLSHGAIVAREFGLPAVAGLPDITRQLTTGQRIKVDGGKGTVGIIP